MAFELAVMMDDIEAARNYAPVHDRFGYALGYENGSMCARCTTALAGPSQRIFRWRSRSEQADEDAIILLCDACDAIWRARRAP